MAPLGVTLLALLLATADAAAAVPPADAAEERVLPEGEAAPGVEGVEADAARFDVDEPPPARLTYPLTMGVPMRSREGRAAAGQPLLRYGLSLDVGVPDLAFLSLVYRPYWWLRASVGGSFNLVGPGVRAGVTLAALDFPVTPTLSADVGGFFSGTPRPLLRDLLDDPELEAQLGDLSYQFLDLQGGLEVGAPRRFVFFTRLGVSFIRASSSSARVLGEILDDDDLAVEGVSVQGLVPALKLGFIVYLM